jgi:type I restriction enzyme R subunit
LSLIPLAAEPVVEYELYKIDQRAKPLVSALILHDVGTKEDRKNEVDDFKDGKIDILFVYNMLLTGFDAKAAKETIHR